MLLNPCKQTKNSKTVSITLIYDFLCDSGQEKLLQYVGIVLAMNACSWVFHVGYYKYMGHPWSSINGPLIDQKKMRIDFYACGKLRRCEWSCTQGNPDQDKCSKCFRPNCAMIELSECSS